ncbi:MAG: hypothetical protein U0K93_05825, partial [Acutalibacteraceae bacterium]|nr:hypothetical protein [Acutalibacteraceae bacterium]
MASSNKKREKSGKTLSWIFGISKKYVPVILLVTFFSAMASLAAVALAVLSKDVLEIATKDKEGSLVYYGILLLIVIVIQIALNITDTLLKCFTDIKLAMSIRKRMFTVISKRKYSEISEYH